MYSEIGQEGLNFWRSHGGRMAQFVEADKTFVPADIGFFGADGVAAQADRFAEAVGDFLLFV